MMNKIHFSQGFTLAELLIVISIVSILASIGAPDLQTMLQNNKMVALTNELLTALNYTRSNAVTRGSSVSICKSNATQTNCENSATWGTGWIVFEDSNNNSSVDGDETILNVYESQENNLRLNHNNNKNRVVYNNQGFSSGYAGTFLICDSRGNSAKRGIVISNTGRTRTAIRSELADCPESEE